MPYCFCLDACCLPSIAGVVAHLPRGSFSLSQSLLCKATGLSAPELPDGRDWRTPHPLCLEELTVGYCQEPYVTHFVTQKENFNKASKGSAAIFRGKAFYEQVHGNSQEAAVATSPAEREQRHPILSLGCHHSPI